MPCARQPQLLNFKERHRHAIAIDEGKVDGRKEKDTCIKYVGASPIFFSSSLADVALWLGPYMSISGKTSLCTRTKTVWKCRQITTTTTTHNPARRPANPPARLAFRQEKQQTRQTKGAGAQTKTTTKKICQRTQWFNQCIILKNMRK